MMNIKSIARCEVYLFNDSQKDYSSNSLKQFVYYLRYLGKRGQINFSLTSGPDSLHPGLSIGENFTLDSISKSLIHNSEEHLNNKILSIENPYTTELVKMLPEFSTQLEELSMEAKAIVSIVKSLLSKSEYLFLVNAEKYLSLETLDIFKQAIKTEALEFSRKILIESKKNQNWIDLATQIVEKEISGEFKNYPNPLSTLTTDKTHKKPYHFTLIKKAS